MKMHFETGVCEMVAILSRGDEFNLSWNSRTSYGMSSVIISEKINAL